jgi:hypothetical protein
MCIICNVPPSDPWKADDVLVTFDKSRDAMKAAADAMLTVSKAAYPQYRKNYDRTHKQMVRMMRMWNRLEQTREVGHVQKLPDKENGDHGSS